MTLTEHVVDLATELHVFVWTCLNPETYPQGRATEDGFGNRTVYLSHQPAEPWEYWIAMHELGHHANGWGKQPFLAEEALAWRWAIDHSQIELTPEHAYDMLCALLSHSLKKDGTRDRRYAKSEVFDQMTSELAERATT